MRLLRPLCLLLLLAAGSFASETQSVLDSNIAFYDGESYRYVIPAPAGLKMVTGEATRDGFSFAFIPNRETYDSASVVLGVSIYKIRGMTFDQVIDNDTLSLRQYVDSAVTFRRIDSIRAADGEPLVAFYFDNKKGFSSDVMTAYFDGGTEVLIFNLIIAETVLRFKTEELFVNCIRSFKPLRRNTLGTR